MRKLERENTRLEKELEKARLIIDVQGKVAGLLGLSLEDGTNSVKAAEALAKYVGVKPACDALRVARATFYRRRRPSTGHQQPRPTPARALSEKEREKGLRHVVFGAIRGPVPGRGGGDPARRGRLPVQRTYDVSRSGLPGAGSGTPSAAESSRIPETRVDGDGPKPGLVLGYHTAAGAEEVELLLPLRHHGHLQPLRRGMDGGGSGRARPWPGA